MVYSYYFKAFIKSILFFHWSGQVLRLTVEDYIVIKHTLYTAILRKVVGKSHTTIPKGIVGGFKFTVL